MKCVQNLKILVHGKNRRPKGKKD